MSYVPYQVDYAVNNVSKTIGVSKKKVTFKFGFADNDALSAGNAGAQCRGSEHQVDFIWSLKSGKRQILVDGKEAHFSESGQNGWTADRTFQHGFMLHSPGRGSIRCHLISALPNYDAPGGNRPFDVRVNGVSFFDFCKIFQLGTSSMIVRPAPRTYGGRSGGENDAYISYEERQLIARAKLESMKDYQNRPPAPSPSPAEIAPAPAPVAEQSLITFDDPPAPPQAQPNQRTASSVTLDPALMGRNRSDQSGPTYPAPMGAPPPPVAAPYSNYTLPPAPAPAYGAPPPAAPVYGGYGAPPPVAAPAPYSNYTLPPAPAPPAAGPYGQAPPAAYGAPPPVTTPTNFAQSYAQPPTPSNPAGGAPAFASPQSATSYGSAPSFAQPPRY